MMQVPNQTVKPICGKKSNMPMSDELDYLGKDYSEEQIKKMWDSATPKKTFTAEEIRAKLLIINPQIIYNSEHTNPFLYQDTKEWYNELEKYI